MAIIIIRKTGTRNGVADEQKIEVLRRYLAGEKADDAFVSVFGSGKAEKRPAMKISQWCRAIQKRINGGDKRLADLCLKAGIAKDDGGDTQPPATKKTSTVGSKK